MPNDDSGQAAPAQASNRPARLPWFPLYVEDFHTATEHLDDAQVGLYLRLMMLASRLPGHHLPSDPGEVCRLLRKTRHHAPRVREILEAFWTLEEAGWIQKRLASELRKAAHRHEQRLRNLAGSISHNTKSSPTLQLQMSDPLQLQTSAQSDGAFPAKAPKRNKRGRPNGGAGRTARTGAHNPQYSENTSRAHAREGDLDLEKEKKLDAARAAHEIDAIAQGKAFLCTHIPATRARSYVEAGHVTIEQCQKVGIL